MQEQDSLSHALPDVPTGEVLSEHRIAERNNSIVVIVIPIAYYNPYFIVVYFFALAAE